MFRLIFLSLIFFCFSGCDKNNLSRIKTTDVLTQASDLYHSGLEHLKAHNYKKAIENFESTKSIYPYSFYAEDSLIKLVEIHEKKGKYDDAILNIEELIDFYGTRQDMESLRYHHAILYYKNLSSQLRDLKLINKVSNVLEAFAADYPNSTNLPDIKEKISIVNGRLVYLEMEIGYYYEIQRNYIASLKRYLIAYHFSKYNKYRAEILYRIYYCYWMMGLQQEGRKYFDELQKDFSDSKWYNYTMSIKDRK